MELAITVIGADRPGIVAEVAEALAKLGANLTDSTMTLLRGHFTMTLVCTTSASREAVQSSLDGLPGLMIAVREVAAEDPVGGGGNPYLLNVHGADRLGIVATVTRAVAEHGGNITDLSTRLIGPLYVLLAEVDLPDGVARELEARLKELADELGVEVSMHKLDSDVM